MAWRDAVGEQAANKQTKTRRVTAKEKRRQKEKATKHLCRNIMFMSGRSGHNLYRELVHARAHMSRGHLLGNWRRPTLNMNRKADGKVEKDKKAISAR